MREIRHLAVVTVGIVMMGACGSGGHQRSRSSPTTALRGVGAGSTVSSPSPSSVTTGRRNGWWTYGGDAQRSGIAADGPRDGAHVRRSWTSARLDGDVYAQPLIVGGVVFVATEHDTVYALDAANGTIRWQRHLGEPVPNSSLPCGNVDPVGVTSTPVVDVAAARLYVVGLVAPLEHVLFELDAHNGNQVASIRVDAPGADPGAQNQRAALTLTNNTVFIPFGGRYGDCGDYRGRVVAVSVRNGSLRATTSYTLPTTRRGGFWAPPGLVVASDGSLFVASGNSAGTTTYDDGNSVLRFDASLHLRDVWAPRDWADLNSNDTDIGATNPVLVAGDRVFQIGKSGTGYLLDAVHLGGVGGELYASDVCGGGGAYGAVAHDQATLYVPCSSGLARVSVHDNSFSTDWRAKASTPGPPVVASSTVWFVATDNGTLEALDAGTGRKLSSRHIGTAPSRFTAPAVGDNEVVVAADRRVIAFAD